MPKNKETPQEKETERKEPEQKRPEAAGSEKTENFGFEKVTKQAKRSMVDGVFSGVASKYDLMNDIMSFGLHRLWKEELSARIVNLDSRIIDVAGGTGDITISIKQRGGRLNKNPHITVCDINEDMLNIGRDKVIDNNILDNIEFVVADAENLPFPDNSFDYYTIAFGIRNIVSIKQALAEAYRVLRPTGKFLCLEFSQVENAFLQPVYDLYLTKILPSVGGCVTDNAAAYKYLAESIKLFPGAEEFKDIICEAGFSDVNYKKLSFGIVALHSGYK